MACVEYYKMIGDYVLWIKWFDEWTSRSLAWLKVCFDIHFVAQNSLTFKFISKIYVANR